MNWDRIEGNWRQFKGKAKEQWGKLTDDDVTSSPASATRWSAACRKSHGITRDEADKQVRDWESRLH